MAADRPARARRRGRGRGGAVVRARRATRSSTATGAAARVSSTSWSRARLGARVLRGEDPPRAPRSAPRSRRSPSPSSAGCAPSRLRWLAEHPDRRAPHAALRRRVGARGPRRRPGDRRDRGRVLERSRSSALRFRLARCQHDVCQWRRSSGASTAPRPRGRARAGSRGRSRGSGTSSPPGTAGCGGPRSDRRACSRGARRPDQPKTAQRTSAAITTSATATITMSLLRFAWERNGFRPTPLR